MNVCARCGEEVRYGTRGTTTGWLHREDVDHQPAFGRLWTPEDQAYVEAELDKERTRVVTKTKGKGDNKTEFEVEETYTARAHSLKAAAKKALEDDEEGDEDVVPDEIPEPEQRAVEVDPENFPPRAGIRQIINLILRTDGWELVNVTQSRGPYIGSSGKVLSTSTSTVVRARGPEVDSGRALAVASWRDGAFDFAITGILKGNVVSMTQANSTALKAWIKETAP